MNKILVYGFPHTGTSILRKLIGNSSDVYEVSEEVHYVDEVLGKGVVLRYSDGQHSPPPTKVLQDNIVIKYAGGKPMPMNFHKTGYKNYKIVLCIKNPYDAFGSLFSRFGHFNFEGCTVSDWVHYGNLFMYFRDNPYPRVFTIKYEEFFDNDFQKIKRLFKFLNLKYSKETIIYNERPVFITKNPLIPKNKPSRFGDSHGAFRNWQMNQPFTDRSGESVKFLSPDMKKILSDLEITKKLGY